VYDHFAALLSGRIVLNQLGIDVAAYFASEIEESAVEVTRIRHGEAVKQIGCVTEITRKTVYA
jgi:hypothetical protein